MLRPGDRISHFEIVGKLGAGGMGVVYSARDVELDRTVALKFLPSHLSADPEAKERFMQEAKAASALDHANICTIHEIGETQDGELYIVMAYYEGQTLKYRLANEEIDLAAALDIARQLGVALERAHEAGIIHRDLKPANIMVTNRGEVKLLDFGLAKLVSGVDLTTAGSTLGTAAYMSPEQARGETVDARTDVWSFGVVLYEMLAGRKPFEGDYEQALLYAILNEEPPPIEELRPEVPAQAAEVVAGCLKKDPGQRLDGMAAVLAGLSSRLHASPAESKPALSRVSGRTQAGIAIALLVFVLLLLVWRSRSPDVPREGVSEDVIAVLPFTVRGAPELDYLSEGMVDLISEKLDGAGGVRALNPRAVIPVAIREGWTRGDAEAGSRVARQLGAGRYVTGDILKVGGRLRLAAYLTDTGRPNVPIEEAAVEGTPEDLFDVIDDLVTDLLGGFLSGPNVRLQKLAVSTSASIEATKEYLLGERLLRSGQYREAAAAYDRAVAVDSTFALAYYRKSIAADWIDAPDIRVLADQAVEFSSRLSGRDRRLLEALRLRRRGQVEESEKLYRDHLHTYPDEVEALAQLGEMYFHENPRMGRSILESRPPFEHLVDLEETNLIAQIHLARIDALEGRLDLLAERADVFRTRAPDSERQVEVDAMYAYAARDTALQAEIRRRLPERPWFYTFYAAHGVARFARDIRGALTLLENRPSDEPLLLAMIPQYYVALGRPGDFRRFMESSEVVRNPSWDLMEAFILTSGLLEPDRDRLATLRNRIRTNDLDEVLRTGFIRAHDDITERFLAFERDYHVGLLSVWLDEQDVSVEMLGRLNQAEDFEGLGSVRGDAVRSLHAEILLHQGDEESALRQLREIKYHVPHAATVRTLVDGTRSRFLRAELEYAIGDREVARSFLQGLDESWSPFDGVYRVEVYERLGSLAESDGDTETAIRYYSLLLEQWQECEGELLPRRNALRDRLDRLIAEAVREPSG